MMWHMPKMILSLEYINRLIVITCDSVERGLLHCNTLQCISDSAIMFCINWKKEILMKKKRLASL